MIDNRQKLLHTAMTLFAAHGYDAVGVQQIASEAGVTKPTLYHYFQSKQGLLEAILQVHGEALLALVRQTAQYQGDLTQSLRAVITAYFTLATEQPTFYRMLLVLSFTPPAHDAYLAVIELQRRQLLLLEYLFQQATRDHGNMAGRHQQYAITLRGLIDSYVGMGLQGYTHLDTPDLVTRLTQQFMYGLFS